MEEKKKENKTISIHNAKEKSMGQGKPSYEDLNNYCMQLLQQNRRLIAQMQKMDMENLFRRLDYLFKVLELRQCFEEDFVKTCSTEIVQGMTPQPEKEEEPEREGVKENPKENSYGQTSKTK